jgi:uncharacterized UBP type Zn finger protein
VAEQEGLTHFEDKPAVQEDTKETEPTLSVKRYKGLVNLGNTCYMNSFLQALYNMKEYREALISFDD